MTISASPGLLVLNQYYAPDSASTGWYAAGICEGLVRRGWTVRVVTGMPSYTETSDPAPSREVRKGVEVHRVPVALKGRSTPIRRFGGYLHYQWGAWRLGRRLIAASPPDVLLTFHNSPFVGALGSRFAREYGLPFVYSPFDFTPDAQRVAGWSAPEWLFGLFERLNDYIHEGAERIAVLSEAMADVLVEEKGVEREKLSVVPLWARPELGPDVGDGSDREALRRELGAAQDDLLLLYAGNMGLLQELDPLLDAAATLRDESVQFVFMGQGVRRPRVESRVAAEQLENVTLLGFVPDERYRTVIAASDAAFVTLREGAERISMPSRALTFLSAGVPLVALMPRAGGIARLVDETGCGWRVGGGDDLVDLVRRLVAAPSEVGEAATRAAAAYRDRFGRERTVAAYERILGEACR